MSSPADLNEEEEAELIEIEALLAKSNITPATLDSIKESPTETDYQIYLAVERIQVPEILFQPGIVGIDQMGISEAIYHVLKQFDNQQCASMLKNVFITGGNAMYPNFKERLLRDIQPIIPVDTKLSVLMANNPILDAWHGASKWANNTEQFQRASVTKLDYEEKGGEFLKEYFASNRVFSPL